MKQGRLNHVTDTHNGNSRGSNLSGLGNVGGMHHNQIIIPINNSNN